MTETRFSVALSRLSSGLLFLCMVVVLWGAFVRFSRSGDGCGESWPLCDGALIPSEAATATWIEYTHRITSGVFGIGILLLFALVFYATSRGAPLRKFAAGALIFTITEALIGAGLVLRGLVGDNSSLERSLWLMGHLVNTLILFYFLVAVSVQLRVKDRALHLVPSFRYLAPLLGFLVLAMSGSLASLSNSLYPSTSLADGLARDLSSAEPLLVRLRIFHPLLGILFFSLTVYWWRLLYFRLPRLTEQILWLVGGNVLVGGATLLFLSPLAGKLLHLLLADLIWIQLVAGALLLHSVHKQKNSRSQELVNSEPVFS